MSDLMIAALVYADGVYPDEAVATSLHEGEPRLLIVNKFGKIEADGGGLREAISDAVYLGIPVLVGVPMRNLDRWRALAGSFSVDLVAFKKEISDWLEWKGLS